MGNNDYRVDKRTGALIFNPKNDKPKIEILYEKITKLEEEKTSLKKEVKSLNEKIKLIEEAIEKVKKVKADE
ncbi:MAG: hypothetical protein Q4Q13_07290 [Vagococcus sp.]|nr:hypothetical protein [Vagococcus sp.]